MKFEVRDKGSVTAQWVVGLAVKPDTWNTGVAEEDSCPLTSTLA